MIESFSGPTGIIMDQHYHVIVWIDHREAKIFHFSADDVKSDVLRSHATGHHLEHRANKPGSGHQGVDTEFFGRVAAALSGAGALLLTGPSTAKLEFKNYIASHAPGLAQRISGVEALDHPSDASLLAMARRFFKADDRMHSQKS